MVDTSAIESVEKKKRPAELNTKSTALKTEASLLAELVLNNRKRTFKMFASDLDAPLVEDPSLVKMKVKCKVDAFYSKLGEVPGVLVDKVGRQKILKDLGYEKPELKTVAEPN